MTPMFSSDAELESALRALRAPPAPAFAAELDQRAAAGFPRAAGSGAGLLAAFLERLRATPPRRILAPAGAFAVVAIVVATTVVSISGGSGDRTLIDSGAAVEKPAQNPLTHSAHPQAQPGKSMPSAVAPSSAGSSESSAGADSSAPQFFDAPAEAGSAEKIVPQIRPGPGPFAAGHTQRNIERSASIVLATDPDGLRDAAAGVFTAVHGAEGIVLNSSIDGGQKGGVANFELLIPTAKLNDTLAAISAVAEVRSRHDSSDDITAATVGAGERLQDANASIHGLLDQLAAADTDAERAAAEAELRAARAHVAELRSHLSSLQRRANLSRVSVRIETDRSDSGSGGGPWGIGDGFHGAGRVLAVAAGVIVIGLAALAPFALIALLAWLTRSLWVRRSRRAALSRP